MKKTLVQQIKVHADFQGEWIGDARDDGNGDATGDGWGDGREVASGDVRGVDSVFWYT
jgi:hypothetical protein